MNRSTVDKFGIVIGGIITVVPMTWWFRAIIVIIVLGFVCDLLLHTRWIQKLPDILKIVICLCLSYFILVVSWQPIRNEYFMEQEPILERKQTWLTTPGPPTTVMQKAVKIHFKESSLFTEQRRRVIQNEIDKFYIYLSGIGFRLPKEIPPMGVRSVVSETIVTPGTVYDEQVNLPEDGIDKPEVIRRVYANHVFRRMFLTGNREPFGPFGGPTPSIFTDYYLSSFQGENSNGGDDSKWAQAKWVNAIWDIRTEYNQDFSDRLLFYVKEQWLMPKPTDQDFDRFFMQRFLAGLFVIDNAGQNESQIREILKRRGLQ